MTRQLDFFGSTPPDSSPVGLVVRCPLRPCPSCGAIDSVIGSSSGPHYGELTCFVCERHSGWISKTTFDFVSSIIRHIGRPTEPILINLSSNSNPTNSCISHE
jgi:hypothetical protein